VKKTLKDSAAIVALTLAMLCLINVVGLFIPDDGESWTAVALALGLYAHLRMDNK